MQAPGEKLTSAIEGTAAQWGRAGRVGFLGLGLHYDLIALHETLANELFKYLLSRHLYTLLVPPEKSKRLFT